MTQLRHTYKNEPVEDNMPSFMRRNGRMEKGAGKMVNAAGDINAGSIKELADRVATLSAMVSGGELQSTDGAPTKLTPSEVRERHDYLKASFADQGSDGIKLIGETFSEDVHDTMDRHGFTTELIARKDVVDDSDNRVKILRKDIVSFQVMNDGEGITQVPEQTFFYPEDYKLQCHVLIDEMELAHAGPDFLEQKYQEALQSIYVRQDRILRNLMLATVGVFNAPVTFTTFTPSVLSGLRTQIMANGLQAANMTFSFDIWDDMIASTEFTSWWEPVHKFQLIMDGKIGKLLGMNLITDGFRNEAQRVLETGEVFVTASNASLGQRGVRRELESTEINHYPLGSPRRGFYLLQMESMFVRDRAITYGFRS